MYESWSIPTSVLLVVPLGVLGAVLAVSLRGMPNDVFFKVGLITIIGLSAKNAILIIEFAKDLYDQGEDLISATLKAARLGTGQAFLQRQPGPFLAQTRWQLVDQALDFIHRLAGTVPRCRFAADGDGRVAVV